MRVNQEGLNATRERHITDRFSRAVDQLGSEKTDVRIGGLYALWRIADHSARDRGAVISRGGAPRSRIPDHDGWRTAPVVGPRAGRASPPGGAMRASESVSTIDPDSERNSMAGRCRD
ncbi:hypothetical protein [Streptomyces sp. KS 21]|uniref:hypothetical protein n=1 Tax=Streptomyces sp. KS 21 TaxID=2485150 RepID=UPI001FB8CC25|nr:hypothetical protein [Streptomyces sp. KS 21]